MTCKRFGVLPLVLVALSISIDAQERTPQAPKPSVDRESKWREDFQFFAKGLRASGTTLDLQRGISSRGQKDVDKLYPKETFDAEIAALSSEVPKLIDSEVVLRLMRLMASAHVAHNIVRIPLSYGFFNRLPLEFTWFTDGLAVTGASSDHIDALGTRVIKVGSFTPEQLLEAVKPYIAHESQVWLRSEASSFIRWGAVLRHFGLLNKDHQVTLTLQKTDGSSFTLPVQVADPRVQTPSIYAGLHVQPPLALSRSEPYYWSQLLPDPNVLYIQFNACANDPKGPFNDFARQALTEADSHSVKSVVIDLRRNGGGDSRVISPLISGLGSRKAIKHVYVLIGTSTLSSAVDNATEMKSTLHAKLVGSEAGQGAGGYGEVKLLVLPNSKLIVQFTTKFFGSGKGLDALVPDEVVHTKLSDAVACRDTVLETVLAEEK